MLEGVLTYCMHFCLACCAFSHSSTSVSINSAKWPSDLDIKGEILFHHQKLKYQYPWETGKGLNDSVIMRKTKPATAWGKWRWNCKDVRKNIYQLKRKQKFPQYCFCLLQEMVKSLKIMLTDALFYDSLCPAILHYSCHSITGERQISASLCPWFAIQFSIIAVHCYPLLVLLMWM